MATWNNAIFAVLLSFSILLYTHTHMFWHMLMSRILSIKQCVQNATGSPWIPEPTKSARVLVVFILA